MQEFQPKNKEGKYIASMGNEYQSTFLPIFQNAEMKIKKLIIIYFLYKKSIPLLREIISRYISEVDKKIPANLPNRTVYINGLVKTSNTLIKTMKKKQDEFPAVFTMVVENAEKNGLKIPKINNPIELINYVEKNKSKYRMWEQAKGSVRVLNYPKEIKNYINNLAGKVITTDETGKKPISLWQKAELDIRYSHQMEMLQKAIDSGNDLFWISSHPDCSKRCEKWQGKLVSVSKSSTMSGFRVEKVDGYWVYSLKEIMAQKDKYGYNNNIINGFNCRHYLIKYESGKYPPKEYSKEDVHKMRAIEDRIRSMEREIRKLKEEMILSQQANDLKTVRLLKIEIADMTKKYKEFCNKNGFAWFDYRIKVQ